MNLDWLICIQEFGVPSEMANMTWFMNIQKNLPLRDIKPTIIIPLVPKLGQGVIHDGLQTFLFYLINRLRPAPKIQ
jgi:hypothetical protein